jgi:hypothetical protein
MKTPFSSLAITALAAALVVFGFARPSYAQPQQTPAAPQSPAATPAKHTITVNFDYDFDRTPACPQPANKPCIQQFVVYDVSGGFGPTKRFQLFIIPVPTGAKGKVKGITGTSQPLSFQPGQHLIGVAAQEPDQRESDVRLCRVVVRIR